MHFISNVSAITALLLTTGSALAVTKTFSGSISNDAAVAGNWIPSGVPTAIDDVIIPAGRTASLSSGGSDQRYRSLDVAGRLTITSRTLFINQGGITLNNGVIDVSRTSAITDGELILDGGVQSVQGTGSITFSGDDGFLLLINGCQATLGAGVSLIAASNQSNFVTIDPTSSLQIVGAVDARGGGTLTFAGTITNYNASVNSLTGGSWLLRGGNITMPVGTNIVNIGANTTVSFGGGSFNGFGNIAGNLGTLELINTQDRAFIPGGSPGTFQNGGTIKLDSGSILTITGNFRTLPGSVIDLTMSGSDVNLQQSRIVVSQQAQLNNTGLLRVRYAGFLPPDCGDTFQVLTHASRIAGFGTYESVPAASTATVLFNVATNTRVQVSGNCAGQSTCDDIDFNNNNVFPEDADVIDFFTVLAGGTCD